MNKNILDWIINNGLAFDAPDEEWITTKNGHHVLIDGEGEIQAGMGGNFNGTKIDEVPLKKGAKFVPQKFTPKPGKLGQIDSKKLSDTLNASSSSYGDVKQFVQGQVNRIKSLIHQDESTRAAAKECIELVNSLERAVDGLPDKQKNDMYNMACNAVYLITEETRNNGYAKYFKAAGNEQVARDYAAKARFERRQLVISCAPMRSLIAFKNGELDTDYSGKIGGVDMGKPMSFEKADEGNGNPGFRQVRGSTTNCQSCVLAYELRLRGWDVEAKLNSHYRSSPEILASVTQNAWIDKKTGLPPVPKKITVGNSRDLYDTLSKEIKPGERYHFSCEWKNGDGHIMTMEKTKGGDLRLFDPQTGRKYDGFAAIDKEYFSDINYASKPDIYRVDNMIPNVEVMNEVLTKGGTYA